MANKLKKPPGLKNKKYFYKSFNLKTNISM